MVGEVGVGGKAGPLAKTRKAEALRERDQLDPVESVAADLALNTRDSYSRALELFTEWLDLEDPKTAALGYPIMLVGVRPPAVRRWRAWLLDRYAPATVNARLAGLRRFYTELLEEGVVRRNPCDGIKRPATPQYSPLAVLTEREAQDTLRVCAEDPTLRGRRDEALLGLAFSCALRKEELLSLRPRDIALESGYDVVRFVRKGGRSARSPLTPRTLRRLLAWVEDAQLPNDGPLWRSVCGPPSRPDAPSWRVGETALSRSALDDLVARRVAAAGIEATITPHCLRRSACDWLWQRGVEPQLIKAFMGHRSITTTDRYRVERQSLEGHAAHVLGWV